MREYCAFYGTAPGDDALLRLARACLADPVATGVQLLAGTADGEPAGFATIYWLWSFISAIGRASVLDHSQKIVPNPA
ncbi:MAG: hypothetical protein ACEQSX_15070, partial [Baekduiaceae bacterium]